MAKKSTRAKKREEAQQKHGEVRGVLFIALGIFLAICVYFEAIGIVGEAITNVLFGLMGAFAYALPPVLVIGGIVSIAYAFSVPQRGRMAFILLGVYFLIVLLHIMAAFSTENTGFTDYVAHGYTAGGELLKGGGALGAILSYPLLLLLGEPGAYIFLITGILVVILLVTRLSLRETGRQVKTRVQAGIQQANERHAARRQQLYIEDLHEGEEVPMFSGRKKRSRKTVRALGGGPDIDYLPTEGELNRQPKRRRKKDEDSIFDDDFGGSLYDSTPDEPVIEIYEEPAHPGPKPTVRELKERAKQPGPEVIFPEPEPDDFIATPVAAGARPGRRFAAQDEGAAALSTPPWEGETALNETIEEIAVAEQAEKPPYVPPSFSLLNPPRASYGRVNAEVPAEKGKLLIDTLESFNVKAKIVNISVGPVITRYELAPAPGVRVNRITTLSDDIALALAAPRVRIEAPIPGKSAVGIEVPNKDTATVVLRDIVESREFMNAASPITLALGKDIAGKIIVSDLAKMPHLLIAGATGSGKSVCINDIIISLVYKCTPDDLQLILVDPKVVELSAFNVLPHLKVPVVTDPKKAAGALAYGVREMTERYKKFAEAGARDLARYNELQTEAEHRLPKLVIIIDELADLMMVAPDTVEDSICRIAQLGRASGIHLIVATQRPSADVITGLIKANIPSRIAFAVASAIDSRIILDTGGAEKLLGRGDMLFQPNGAGKPVRAQGAYVSDEEVERIVKHFSAQAAEPAFDEEMIEQMELPINGGGGGAQGGGKHEDDLLGEAVRIVLDTGQASISMVQRRLRVGYARAARLIDIMEQHGYVGPPEGSKPRKLLITRLQYEQTFGQIAGDAGAGGEADEEA